METTVKRQKLALRNSGSLFNFLMAQNASIPVVGKGATILHWSDRDAYEVVEISEDGSRVTIQQYEAERIDGLGMSDCQTYKYEKLNPCKQVIVWFRGAWRYEIHSITWMKGVHDSFSGYADMKRTGCFDDQGNLKLIPGMTRMKKSYSKVNIIFGVKDEHYDFSF